ncbi:hypothetical protein ACP70R_013729 [Stipagrostis hirtigluma subsp. patula]
MGSAGDLDRISALPDDLLHLILTFVREATAVTRTAALSQRWRRVWVHARDLSFFYGKVIRGGADPGRAVGFVDWVFAQRGDADIGSLNIDMSRSPPHAWTSPPDVDLGSPGGTSPGERVSGWLRYAMRTVAGSFRLDLPHAETGHGTVDDVVELPGRGRMTSIRGGPTSKAR